MKLQVIVFIDAAINMPSAANAPNTTMRMNLDFAWSEFATNQERPEWKHYFRL
jgi:hypothetical protein